jgi:hypothetical protein
MMYKFSLQNIHGEIIAIIHSFRLTGNVFIPVCLFKKSVSVNEIYFICAEFIRILVVAIVIGLVNVDIRCFFSTERFYISM